MEYTGIERRHDYCTQEGNIARIMAGIESVDRRVNGSMESIKDHIRQGEKWRIALVGIVFAGIIQVVSFAYLFGTQQQIVKHNSKAVEQWINQQVKKGG